MILLIAASSGPTINHPCCVASGTAVAGDREHPGDFSNFEIFWKF
jgi:hypothetical protein